jgi:hypothetical protein
VATGRDTRLLGPYIAKLDQQQMARAPARPFRRVLEFFLRQVPPRALCCHAEVGRGSPARGARRQRTREPLPGRLSELAEPPASLPPGLNNQTSRTKARLREDLSTTPPRLERG